MFTEQQITEVLNDIQRQVPQMWRKRLFRKMKKTPTAEFIVKKALKRKDLDPKKREELELLFRTGEFSKEEEMVDEKLAEKIDKFVARKIKEAIKEGKLPTKEELEKLPFYKKYAQAKESSN